MKNVIANRAGHAVYLYRGPVGRPAVIGEPVGVAIGGRRPRLERHGPGAIVRFVGPRPRGSVVEVPSRGGGSGCIMRAWVVAVLWLRRDYARNGRRGDRSSRACGRQVSSPGAPGCGRSCSVRERGRRPGTGSRREGHERPDIWTVRRRRRLRSAGDPVAAAQRVTW